MSLEKIKQDAKSILDLLQQNESSKNKKQINSQILELIKDINNSIEQEKNA